MDAVRDAQTLKALHRLGCFMWKRIEGLGGEAQFVDRHSIGLKREPTEPAYCRPLVPRGVAVAEHQADSKRVVQSHSRQLTGGCQNQ